ncbi:MAG TPA: hypothetical protein VGU43_00055 [Thermoplasmata archaeon]|nr:hypothetical protein [Thermoplasmata archaeon]
MGAATSYRYQPAGTYDLSGPSDWKYRHERTTRYITWLALLLTVAVAVEVEGLTRGRGGLSGFTTPEGLLAVFAPLASFGIGVWTLRRSATGLALDADGLRLLYPGGRSVRVPLLVPRLRLRLYEWIRPAGSLAGAPYRHQIRTQWLRLTPITAEAFEAIVQHARKLQLSVSVRPVVHDWFGVAYSRYTVTARNGAVPVGWARPVTAGPPASTGFRDRRP